MSSIRCLLRHMLGKTNGGTTTRIEARGLLMSGTSGKQALISGGNTL